MCKIDKWLEEWLKQEEKPDEYCIALFAATCWEIWKARCRYVFEGVEVDPFECAAKAMRLVRDFV